MVSDMMAGRAAAPGRTRPVPHWSGTGETVLGRRSGAGRLLRAAAQLLNAVSGASPRRATTFSHGKGPGRGGPNRHAFQPSERWGIAAVLLAIGAISLLDALTPAGIVVGFVLCAPILLASMTHSPKQVWLITGAAVLGFLLAAKFGRAPIAPPAVWIPNRLFALAALPASCAIALILQWRRREVERARDEALSASDLNQLLMSLLAHDLRAPLSIASQGFEYVENTLQNGGEPDGLLLSDIRARLQRSLRAINVVLSVARAETEPDGDAGTPRQVTDVRREIEAEIASFAEEAGARGKTLVAELEPVPGGKYAVDGLVLRQVLAILLDNAIRYADPGPVRVEAKVNDERLVVRVSDSGPGISAHQATHGPSDGSGLGLKLCRALAARAGGGLAIEQDSPRGTVFVLTIPTLHSRSTDRLVPTSA